MILAVGPFVGSFEQEIVTFRPYVLWLMSVLKYDKVYISIHFNRSFLYDFIPTENIIPIYKYLSRDELGQNGCMHDSLNIKEFNDLLKGFKNTISKKENCSKKDILSYYINYTKAINQYPIHNKKFQNINIDCINIPDEYKNKCVFIPYIKSKTTMDVYNRLKDPIVIGDMKTYLMNENVIFKFVDYFENGWKYIIGIISSAKIVVCPLSYWTLICNMQKVPVFSYGNSLGQYKEDGIYHLGNKKSIAVPYSVIAMKVLENFLNSVEERKR